MSDDNTTEAAEAAAKADAQQAQVDEATGAGGRSFEFDGYTYTVLDGQPSPKAVTYIARWTVDDENLAMVLAIVEMVGQDQWATWCGRHESSRINDFWQAMNQAAAQGN